MIKNAYIEILLPHYFLNSYSLKKAKIEGTDMIITKGITFYREISNKKHDRAFRAS